MKVKHAILLGVASAAGGYQLYKRLGRAPKVPDADPRLEVFHEAGEDRGAGNLLVVQPHITPLDFADARFLTAKLSACFDAAKSRGWVSGKTIAILPEHLGTWLVFAGERGACFRARTLDQGLVHVVAPNFISIFSRLVRGQKSPDPFTHALFTAKSRSMAAAYHEVMSGLAGRYACTLVGGSILLPSPEVTDGRLMAGTGRLVNVTATYGSDARAKTALARKCVPSVDEPYLGRGDAQALNTITTPAGRLGVIVGRDAFEPDVYRQYAHLGVDVLANPAQAPGVSAWTSRWSGYPDRVPADVDPSDIGALTESAAWLKYGLPGRARMASAKAAASSMLIGQLWDRAFDGAASGMCHNDPVMAPAVSEAGTVMSVWL